MDIFEIVRHEAAQTPKGPLSSFVQLRTLYIKSALGGALGDIWIHNAQVEQQ